MDFSVTITTFNRAKSLRSSLEALAQQDYPLDAVEIIVADNGSTDHTKGVADAFAARLRAEINLPVHLVDERLTSYEAESTIAKSKRRDVRASGIIDSRAATIILQDYLNQKLPPPPPSDEEPS